MKAWTLLNASLNASTSKSTGRQATAWKKILPDFRQRGAVPGICRARRSQRAGRSRPFAVYRRLQNRHQRHGLSHDCFRADRIEKELQETEEGATIPETNVHTQENLVQLKKRGRMLVASYEALRFQRLDLFTVTLRQIGAYIARTQLKDAVSVLEKGRRQQQRSAGCRHGGRSAYL